MAGCDLEGPAGLGKSAKSFPLDGIASGFAPAFGALGVPGNSCEIREEGRRSGGLDSLRWNGVGFLWLRSPQCGANLRRPLHGVACCASKVVGR